MKDKQIKRILVDGVGQIYSKDNKKIELFQKSGDDWYGYGNKEFNGKYVIEVEYWEIPYYYIFYV